MEPIDFHSILFSYYGSQGVQWSQLSTH